MRKSKKRIINQAIAVALSVSMTTPNVVAMADPIQGDASDTKTELVVDDNEDSGTKVDNEDSSTTDSEKQDDTVKENETEGDAEGSNDSQGKSDEESEDDTEDKTEGESNVDESKADTDSEEEKKEEEDTEKVEKTDDTTEDSSKTDDEKDTTKEKDTTTASSSETILDKVETIIENVVEAVTGKKSYKKFASDDFILWWFNEATDEEKSEWYESVTKYDEDKASSSNVKYPAYSSDEFDDWFNEKAIKETTKSYTVNGETMEVPELDVSVLASWIKYQSEDDAFAFINEVLSNYYAVISGNADANINPTSVIGDLWPDNWGAGADYKTKGTGVKSNPYILDSVEDLRAFAKDVANGEYLNRDAYFYLKHGTYDLGGCWIPIGFCLNNGDKEYVPFDGHFAGEDGAVIKNLGFSASATLNVSATLADTIRAQKSIGFFGLIDGATINNIQIETSGTIETSAEMAGVLAGHAIDSTIREVEVNASKIKGTTYVGGVVGYAESSSKSAETRDMVIEDVTCNKVAVYTFNPVSNDPNYGVDGYGAVGGIVGFAENASIIDTEVSTNTGDGNHIYGIHSYVGGIVGVSENSDILNSYLKNGEVGDHDAYAVGGIVGGYAGGAVKVARFSGNITKPTTTNNYSACFIGARVNGAGFVYGENGDIGYLFADTKGKADTGICGSRIEDDGIYDDDAYCGYWHSDDTYCTIISGDNQSVPNEMFYQILEDGILNAKNGTKSGNGYLNTDTINHYTADKSGHPTRGYLLSIENPMVDGVQAAEITAYVNGSYKETVTADNLGAFAPGDQVYISFSDMKDNNGYYRMDDDAITPAWYSYYNNNNKFYTYDNYEEGKEKEVKALRQNGGWVLTMPESDTTVGAKYEKVAVAVTTTPSKVTFEVTQTRTGDRANPETKWSVTATDSHGAIITDTNGTLWQDVDPTNNTTYTDDDIRFWIGSMVNKQDNDKYNLTWSTSNTNNNKIISDTTAANGNKADKQAYVTLNLNDSAINDQIEALVKKQHDGGDKDSITTITPYYYHSVVKAVADPEDCQYENNPPKGYCDITIKLNIVDKTATKVDKVNLSQNEMVYNVVRTLTGDRAHPTATYTVNGDAASENTDVMKLNATFTPAYFTSESVNWYLSDEKTQNMGAEGDFTNTNDGTLSVGTASTDAEGTGTALVTLKGVTRTSVDNTFISAAIKTEDEKYTSQMIKNPGETTTYQKYVKVTGKDAVNNSVTDTCHVVVNFKTVDETEIMPDEVEINNKTNLNGYTINYTFAGDSKSDITSRVIRKKDVAHTILDTGKAETLTATVYAEGHKVYDSGKAEYQPYNDTVKWELGVTEASSTLNPYDVLNIDSETGEITVRGYDNSKEGNGFSPWVASLISENKLNGTTVTIRVIAKCERDNTVVDFYDIPVTFTAGTMTNAEDLTYNVVYTKKVGHSVANTDITEDGEWSGNGAQYISATASGNSEAPVFALSDETLVKMEQNASDRKAYATITPNIDAQWIKDVINNRATNNSGTRSLTVDAKTTNGTSLTTSKIDVNFRYDGVDLTATVPSEAKTYKDEYVNTMAKVEDRAITLDVRAAQGDADSTDKSAHLWKYGVVKLDNTTYTSDGVQKNNATYELSGDLADYVKVDENGYLVPLKEIWETSVINKKLTSGSVSGVVTAKKAVGGVEVTDSYYVTINFKYDKTTGVKIDNKDTLHGYKIFYTFEGKNGSKVTARNIYKTDEANTAVVNGKGELPTATVYVGDEIYGGATSSRPYNDKVTWELAMAKANTGLNPYDVLNIDKTTGQITVRGYDASTSESDNGFSPWIASLIKENKLNGTTVTIRVIARSVLDNAIVDYKDIPVSFSAGTMETAEADLDYKLVYTKLNGHSVANAGITESGQWSGTEDRYAYATATGNNESPVFALSDDTLAKIVDQTSYNLKTKATIAPRTDAQWIKDIITKRADTKTNEGKQELTLTAKTANGSSIYNTPMSVNFRYDGVDLTATVPEKVPDTFTSEYLPSMTSIKDRDITLDVVATQGNYSQDNPGTRTWQYGIVKLDNITYSSEGVKENDATYTLSGDLANYAKVENGYIVPIKGLWESQVINQGKTKGTVTGVLTATKDCSGVQTTDSYFVTVNFRYDKAVLDQHEATFDVVYTEDSRTNSKLSHWTGDDFIQLYAQISDESGQDVTPIWESSDPDIVTVDKDGRVYVNEDTWIKEIIDNARNNYDNEVHSGTKTVTVTAKHPTTGKTADTCVFTINFRYDQAILNRNEDIYTIVKTQTSRTLNPSAVWSGNDIRKLNAKMHVAPGQSTNVIWSTEDGKIVTVDEAGNIQPVIDADWMNEIIANKKYTGQKKVAINADNPATTVRDSDNVTVNFIYEDVEMAENNKDMNITITATGSRSNPTYTVTGDLSAQLSAAIHSSKEGETALNWSTADGGLLTVDGNGKLNLVLPTVTDKNGNVSQAQGVTFSNNAHALIREALKHGWTSNNNYITSGNVVITAASTDNRMADQCTVKLNIKFVDNCYSSSGGGGGSSSGGSSGGGTSSTGVTPSSSTTKTYTNMPDYVVKGGQWTKNALDKWFYTNGRTYTNEWAAITNPYADASKGQSQYDWYHFNTDSTMTTGWYTEDGHTYYLHPVGDGTQGRMYTGWNWIDDDGDGIAECYYFEKESNGYKGSLYKSATTPDGYTVNEKGQWMQNGQVITRNLAETKASTLPSYVKTGGTWSKNANGQWMYANGNTQYRSAWAAINNPYADTAKGQEAYSWFHFNLDGSMTTGWFTDSNGSTYYLNPVSDNTQGRMFKGWNWIDDNNDGVYECYYFDATNEATLGQLKKNTTVEGYKVNAKGQWVNDAGTVQTKKK